MEMLLRDSKKEGYFETVIEDGEVSDRPPVLVSDGLHEKREGQLNDNMKPFSSHTRQQLLPIPANWAVTANYQSDIRPSQSIRHLAPAYFSNLQ